MFIVPPNLLGTGQNDVKQKVDSSLNSAYEANEGYTGNLQYQRAQELMKQQQAFNALEAQKNRDFQKSLSDSAYQRQALDLKKAGYNPALVLGGGGASTPSGGSAQSALAAAPNTTAHVKQQNNVLNAFSAIKLANDLLNDLQNRLIKVPKLK